jgi:transposase
VLVGCREPLAECYTPENGRPAIEPVVLLGVLILQFLERVPDRQAVELVKYHLGWKLALHLSLSDPRLSSDDIGLLPAALTGARQE